MARERVPWCLFLGAQGKYVSAGERSGQQGWRWPWRGCGVAALLEKVQRGAGDMLVPPTHPLLHHPATEPHGWGPRCPLRVPPAQGGPWRSFSLQARGSFCWSSQL